MPAFAPTPFGSRRGPADSAVPGSDGPGDEAGLKKIGVPALSVLGRLPRAPRRHDRYNCAVCRS